MKRDPHRSKVYSWEREAIHSDLQTAWLTLREAQRLADVVTDRYDSVDRCKVKKGRKNLVRRSYADVTKATIVLAPSWGLNVKTVLHELAHHIDYQRTGKATHGPEFRRTYIELLEQFADADSEQLIRDMNRKGLFVAGQEPDYVINNGTVSRYPF